MEAGEAMSLKLATYRCASPRREDEGLRIGAVRFLPRGVKKEDYARLGYFDVWFPLLAPNRAAVSEYKKSPDKKEAWKRFARQYRKEIESNTDARQAVKLLAAIAEKTPIAIGCYCEDEEFCHRSILKKLIEDAR